MRDVCKLTGVSIKTINHIRFDNGWKHISKDYNINTSKHSQGPVFSEVSQQIKSLVISGKSNQEIRDELNKSGLSSNISSKSISDRIYHIRKLVEKSSTIEPLR